LKLQFYYVLPPRNELQNACYGSVPINYLRMVNRNRAKLSMVVFMMIL